TGSARLGSRVEMSPVLGGNPARIAAGGETVDLGRVRAKIPHTLPAQLQELPWIHALRFQHPALVRGAAQSVLTDDSVASNHAVAGNEQRNRIVRQSSAHSPHRLRPADLLGDPGIGRYLAPRDLQCLAQDRLLELGESAQVKS